MSEVGNVDEMAENGVKILNDDQTLNEFKKNAQLQARQFSLGAILPEYEQLYIDVINEFKSGLK